MCLWIHGARKVIHSREYGVHNAEADGFEGAYVAAPAGLMRNKWLPRNWARYVTGDELKQLHERGATFERDTQAGGPNEARRRKKAERLEREAMAGAIDNVWKDDSKEARMGNLAGESSADAVKVTIEHVEVCLGQGRDTAETDW